VNNSTAFHSAPVSQHRLNLLNVTFIIFACLIGLLLAYLVSINNFVFGSVKGGWTYPKLTNPGVIPLWMALLIALLLGFVALIGDRYILKYETIILIVAFIISVLVQFLLHRIYPIPLWIVVKSDVTTSFYSVAMRYSPLEVLSGYLHLAPSFPKHAMSNMPGKILLFQFIGIF